MLPANGDVKPCEVQASRCFGCYDKDNLPACAEPNSPHYTFDSRRRRFDSRRQKRGTLDVRAAPGC
jgi:hypothetical protein